MQALASDLRYALDPIAFAVEALGFHPDAWQARVLRSSSKRLLMNCSRQSGKSQVAAILAAHRALYYPDQLVLIVSPAERQSRELFRKVADVLDQLVTRPEMSEDNKLSCTLDNHSRIVSLPSSEKTIRGFSAVDLLLIDEAARVTDDLYIAVRPMLAVSGGRLIALSTPFGKRGWWFEAWTNGSDVWERVRVKASECPRIAQAFLAEEKASMGSLFYASEYECEFVETIDQVFSYDEVMAAVSGDVKPLFEVPDAEHGGPVSQSIRPLFGA